MDYLDQNNNPVRLTFMRGPLDSETGNDPEQPDYWSEECRYMYHESELCRDLSKGRRHILSKAHRYLPPYENESSRDWEVRVSQSSLYNFYEQSVKSLMGKMFGKLPMLNDNVPESMVEDLRDADLNGNDWTIVARRYMRAAIEEGISWLIVDYHSTDVSGNLTLADEKKLGVRPYWIKVNQSQVLGVDYEKVGSIHVINRFRFRTNVKIRDGAFGSKWQEEIWCYEPNTVSCYVKDADAKTKKPIWVQKEGYPRVNTLGSVAAVPLNLSDCEIFESKPPLDNLASMNLEHYQIRSDQRRALSVASFPMLAAFGVDNSSSNLRIGPMTAITFEDSNASIKWIESQGAHLLAGDRELIRLESHIRTFGLSFEQPGMYATATGRNIDASDAVAPIINWAHAMRDAIDQVLYFHAAWRKLPNGGSVNVDVSFIKNMLTVEGLKLLLEAYKEGKMSSEAFFARMKDYGLLSNEFDVQEEINRLTAELEEKQKQQLALEQAKAASHPPDQRGAPGQGGTTDPGSGGVGAQ